MTVHRLLRIRFGNDWGECSRLLFQDNTFYSHDHEGTKENCYKSHLVQYCPCRDSTWAKPSTILK
jgi:hypothetical protein